MNKVKPGDKVRVLQASDEEERAHMDLLEGEEGIVKGIESPGDLAKVKIRDWISEAGDEERLKTRDYLIKKEYLRIIDRDARRDHLLEELEKLKEENIE